MSGTAQGEGPPDGAGEEPPADVIPGSSYRLQFNREFTFSDAAALVPYLARLGITHVYASPYLTARPGSHHGYDIIDHNALNPEIGSPGDFGEFTAALRQYGMGQIFDLVPNHMGVMGSENRWWLDVLENGPAADHADFFDIDWRPVKRELRGKVLLPVLADHYGIILYSGDLTLGFDPEAGEFSFWYFNHRFPVDPQKYPSLLKFRLAGLRSELAEDDLCLAAFTDLIADFGRLPGRTVSSEKQRRTRRRDKEEHKSRLARLCRECPRINRFIVENLKVMNGVKGRPASFSQLHAILELQAYRLAFWKTASDEINYRRFFDINELAGLRMENDRVFEATHRFVFGLMGEEGIAGLRIDHVDGLYDPRGYLEKLHRRALGGRPVYIVVEKILAVHERLREDWPVQGTTGHDFANLVNNLFTDPAGERVLNLAYHRFLGRKSDFEEVLYVAKRRIITVEMAGELNVLANQLNRISELNPVTRDFTLNSLRNALIEIVACFPVYRTYVSGTPIHPEDRKYIHWAIVQAKRRSAVIETGVFDFLDSVLSLDIINDVASGYPKSVLDFVMHFQQYTSPVMAKGLEDTTLYRYYRLISLNEVGSDPRRFSVSINAFHYLNQERLKNWPHAMLATSTHDSKRSEDVRARINVLSEIPQEFQVRLARWRFINRRHKRYVDKRLAPSSNDEYLLYQTLLGSWPLRVPDEQGLEQYRRRIGEYMLKAAREAKLLTSWSYTNPEYEQALLDFTGAVLSASANNPFLDDFIPFAESVSPFGLYNSLAQCLLKFTSPGMPDVYQGNELFEFSLTDPDNRRSVDYEQRRYLLGELAALEDLPPTELAPAVQALLNDMADGRCKLYLTWRALNLHARHKTLFQSGDYVPLAVNGAGSDHVCAFARSAEGTAVLTVVPRLVHGLCPDGPPLGPVWSDTWLEIPESLPQRQYRNELDGRSLPVQRIGDKSGILLAAILTYFPVALLMGITGEEPPRETGV